MTYIYLLPKGLDLLWLLFYVSCIVKSLVLFIGIKSQIPMLVGKRHFANPPKLHLPKIEPHPPHAAKPEITRRRPHAAMPEIVSRPPSAAIQIGLERPLSRLPPLTRTHNAYVYIILLFSVIHTTSAKDVDHSKYIIYQPKALTGRTICRFGYVFIPLKYMI